MFSSSYDTLRVSQYISIKKKVVKISENEKRNEEMMNTECDYLIVSTLMLPAPLQLPHGWPLSPTPVPLQLTHVRVSSTVTSFTIFTPLFFIYIGVSQYISIKKNNMKKGETFIMKK